MNEFGQMLAALSDAIALATTHKRTHGADDRFDSLMRECHDALDTLSRVRRSNDHSTNILAGVEQTMKRCIDELATCGVPRRGQTATERVVVPLRTKAKMVWRQATGSNTWHFTVQCSQWPTDLFAQQIGTTRPDAGSLCDECIRAWRTTWLGAPRSRFARP